MNAEPARMLLVTTSGVEMALVFPPFGGADVHVCQTWRPLACHCGSFHRACDRAGMTVVVGPVDSDFHVHPRAIAAAVVPADAAWDRPEIPTIVAHTKDFGPWAAAVVRHLGRSLFPGALVHVGADDLRKLLGHHAAGLRAAVASGPERPVELARRLLESGHLPRDGQAYSLLVSGGHHLDYRDLLGVADTVQEALSPQATIFFHAYFEAPERMNKVSAIYRRDQTRMTPQWRTQPS